MRCIVCGNATPGTVVGRTLLAICRDCDEQGQEPTRPLDRSARHEGAGAWACFDAAELRRDLGAGPIMA